MAHTILAVDDSKSIRDMIKLTLAPLGYRVVEGDNGQSGIEAFKSEPVSLVITDLNMPVMNGFEFIRALRSMPKGAGVPIIMLTTESKPEAKAEGKAAGATGWITKPFTPENLISVAKRLAG